MIKGFIFDLDGVITDSAEFHYCAWRQLAQTLGIEFDRGFNEQLKGISRLDSLEKILCYAGKENSYSPAEKQDLAEKKNQLYLELIESVNADNLLPGIALLLSDLKNKGIKIALASASKNGPFLLEKLGIADYFDTVVNPALLTNGKPDPEIFLKGAQQLGLTPAECVGLEDAVAGIEALNRARIFSVGIGDKFVLAKASYCVEKTEDLKCDIILALANRQAS